MASLEGWGSTIELRPHAPPQRGRPKRTCQCGRRARAVVEEAFWRSRTLRWGTSQCTGVWRSLVAHSLWERGAVGSNPATPTT